MKKLITFFGEGSQNDEALLGGKGAHLNEMVHLGIPVPLGFTITTEACRAYLKSPKWPAGLQNELQQNLRQLEQRMGKRFGDARNPLLLSVRSGAAVSMPGMMDTVLNLGLNDETVQGLMQNTGQERFAYDAYRRFLQMFGNVVLGLEMAHFEILIEEQKAMAGVLYDHELQAADLLGLVMAFKKLIRKETGADFPMDPMLQLKQAIDAVFDSWHSDRATVYRKIHGIPDDLGTAVTVQAMVFGNKGQTSGTGVAFTRNPATGENRLYGEFLWNAQGEDVVAGNRTPEPLLSLQKKMPVLFAELTEIYQRLEKHYRDMQDLEFTIEEGKLYLLQTRNGKRTAAAAVQIAVDLVKEGLIDTKTALRRVTPGDIDQLLHPALIVNHGQPVVAKGLPASPGAGSGKVVFDSRQAAQLGQKGERVILVRKETSPDDIDGMHAAQGILTATGGMTSHAAVVARGMNKCCIAGCGTIVVNEKAQKFLLQDGRAVHSGDMITLNGSTGEVMLGEIATEPAKVTPALYTLLEWADRYSRLKVRANADTPHDANKAIEFGAKGIGLCRTEHMFFELDRIPMMQEMILAKTKAARVKALLKLEVMQIQDFYGIFQAMDGFPVTIRLLDPPLHEFLPRKKAEIELAAKQAGLSTEKLRDMIELLHEVNPMLGHRGCRLMITYPEITEMQVRAIMQAAIRAIKAGIAVQPEIMIPLIGTVKEYQLIAEQIRTIADEILDRQGDSIRRQLSYKIGTMIEVPRACLVAKDIAKEADFFSFGTNDLTQMTFGYSRDDSGKFLNEYLAQGILKHDPFMTLDQEGVGQMVRLGVESGRSAKKSLKIGVCGEHGGDPASVHFFHETGLDYVSCSPYRVPVARLAAAQAALADYPRVAITKITKITTVRRRSDLLQRLSN